MTRGLLAFALAAAAGLASGQQTGGTGAYPAKYNLIDPDPSCRYASTVWTDKGPQCPIYSGAADVDVMAAHPNVMERRPQDAVLDAEHGSLVPYLLCCVGVGMVFSHIQGRLPSIALTGATLLFHVRGRSGCEAQCLLWGYDIFRMQQECVWICFFTFHLLRLLWIQHLGSVRLQVPHARHRPAPFRQECVE